ncbi:hypothetical protein C8F01DRAFT_1370409, partial [Mycena amicta]
MDVPHFPRELEREILEIAAETRSQEVPNLLLVARRVHVWLEPFLYRSIYLGFWENPVRETPAQEAFLSMASSKPPSFLACAVRQVIIDFGDGGITPEILLQFTEALRHCTGITGFAMNAADKGCPLEVPAAREIFRVLDLVHLHRLGAFLSEIMLNPSPMDALQPTFRSLTHLSVFDWNLETVTGLLPFLMALPALTHLALRKNIGPGIWNTLLRHDGCIHLQILVFLIRMASHPPLQIDEDWANDAGHSCRDPRVVVTVYDVWTECIFMQGHTYWHEAEMFVQKRRLGLIPHDHYWTGNFYAGIHTLA